MSVDLLVFGAHPDDIEIGAGGLVARHAAEGLAVGLCDLTEGEMGSNGTVPQRLQEAQEACGILGASWRENLRIPDRRIGADPTHVERVVACIRRHRPRVVVAPYWVDRHPDHPAASALVTEAVFNSGLRRYWADGEPWKPDWVCYYFINDTAPPSFVIDVTDYYERKQRALDAHASQFQPAPDTVGTRLNTPLFRQLVESRDAQWGAQAGVQWAEGIVVREPLLRPNLLKA
ncbi:MAG: bacillithiol biosynthesis deacetylase BshB1 [Acidobacteriota bacterium]